jgi:hypothetical protein
MDKQQATDLARKMAEDLAVAIGDTHRVVEQIEDGVSRFWVTDNPETPEDGFDPSEATFFTATASHSPGRSHVFIIEQSNTDGGGWVFIDADTCFETSF